MEVLTYGGNENTILCNENSKGPGKNFDLEKVWTKGGLTWRGFTIQYKIQYWLSTKCIRY